MSCEVFLGIGSNIGNRKKNLTEAVKGISEIENTDIKCLSNIYETNPVGFTEQNRFLNMACRVQTILTPLKFLGKLQEIEKHMKRIRTIKWGPRIVDIDILLYGELILELPELIIPHPLMFERAFVLIPLKEVYPGKYICGKNIDEQIDKCRDKDGIKYYGMVEMEIL